MTIHHATLAKAAKLGVVMTEDESFARIVAHWTEKNKRSYVAFGPSAAPSALEDMRTWQMITREYPNLKVAQPHVDDKNFVWEISLRNKDVVGEGERLSEAFEDAIDAMALKLKGQKLHEHDDEDGDEDDFDESDPDGEAIAEMEEEAEEGKSVVKRAYKHRYRPFKMTCGDELSQLISAYVTVTDEDGKHIDAKKLVHFAKKNGVWVDDYKNLNIGMQRMNVANRLRALVRKGHTVIWN